MYEARLEILENKSIHLYRMLFCKFSILISRTRQNLLIGQIINIDLS